MIHRLRVDAVLAFALSLGAGAAHAQQPMSGMDMDAPASAASPKAAAQSMAMPSADMPGMDMSGMDMAHAMGGDLGAYPMTRDASGTAWQPDSSPMEGVMGRTHGWAVMADGYATLSYDDQGGPRGGDKTFVESMLMGMAQRPLEGGVLTLRAMGSLDPLMGASGYPLLLATGETANGKTALVDRQHPHDLVMELASVYQHPLVSDLHGFLYVGWPGEPAIGPATYMHRFSGEANPEAPIGHHWLDSTHITFGVVTGGLVWRDWKLETSWFKGREPNQYRYDFDHPRLDSWSARLSWNPTPDWSLQISRAHLKSPEQLTPDVDQDRTTASATYNRAYGAGRWWAGDWQTTFAFGQDRNSPGHTTDAYLLDTAASAGRHTLFFRAENDGKDELFDDQPVNPLSGRVFNVSEYTTGYFYTVPFHSVLAVDVGGLVTRYSLPTALNGTYGTDPTSFLLFTRVKLR
jgi:hypothetical protein